MTETVEQFIARGGKVKTIPDGEVTFQRLSDPRRHGRKK